LNEIKKRWDNHLLFIKWLKNIFGYLDRSHVFHNSLPTLEFIGYNHFKNKVYDHINTQLIDAFKREMEKDRNGM